MIDLELLDVFTDTAYAGNPLAVAIDPPPLSDRQMQQVAAELNLSETVFVQTPGNPATEAWPTRIFTPARELPFAGHPTIGATVAIGRRHRALDRLTLAERAGDVDVEIARKRDGEVATACLTAPNPPAPVTTPDLGAVLAALSLSDADLLEGASVQAWTCGVPFTIVPVADVERLGRARVDTAAWQAGLRSAEAADLYVVAPGAGSGEWRARMFGPGVGIVEDPATGAAASAMAGWLAAHDGITEGSGRWLIDQGVEMGRPSRLEVTAEVRDRSVVRVGVGGSAVVVGSSRIVVP